MFNCLLEIALCIVDLGNPCEHDGVIPPEFMGFQKFEGVEKISGSALIVPSCKVDLTTVDVVKHLQLRIFVSIRKTKAHFIIIDRRIEHGPSLVNLTDRLPALSYHETISFL